MEDTQILLDSIFQEPLQVTASAQSFRKSLSFVSLPEHLDRALENAAKQTVPQAPAASSGRLGPISVTFVVNGNGRRMLLTSDQLGIAGRSNFSTVRANSCVFKGKWVYELMLGSRGVMQLGWCSAKCSFKHSQEEGVGDTDDSYGYDGNRQQKWHMKTPTKYGEVWLIGDVISCAIDCDLGTISFARNGRMLRPAFSGVRLGPGWAYFPAVSLSLAENIRANFGATPLRYPLEGYRPLQDPPRQDLAKAQRLFGYLNRLIPALAQASETKQSAKENPFMAVNMRQPQATNLRSRKAILLLISAHIFEKLAAFLKNGYIVESCLMKFLLQYCDDSDALAPQIHVHHVLDLLWGLLQEPELKRCMDCLMLSLLSSYRYTPVMPDSMYQNDNQILILLLAMVRHEPTRKYIVKNVLFDTVQFPFFMYVKPPIDDVLTQLVPTVWWGYAHEGDQGSDGDISQSEVPPAQTGKGEKHRKSLYLASCRALKEKVAEVEKVQVHVLKMLLVNTDDEQGNCASTRFIFLHKLRKLLRENTLNLSDYHLTSHCRMAVLLCFFHRLIEVLREMWDDFATLHPGQAVPNSEAFVPCQKFYDDTIDYFDTQRLGGLVSYLKKTYREDVNRAQRLKQDHHTQPLPRYREVMLKNDELIDDQRCMYADEPQGQCMASAHSLVEILDGIIMLYGGAAHKQLGKMCNLRDSAHSYVIALEEVKKKISHCPPKLTLVHEELTRAKQVFEEVVAQQARNMVWVIAVIYSKEKQENVFWLLKTILRTLERSSLQDNLFTFVPHYYLDSCISCYNALKNYFHPTCKYSELPDFGVTLQEFARFLCRHFADPRIVYADRKEDLVQALACFVCYPMSMTALESIPVEDRLQMCKALLAPYDEQHPWTSTNWILVRLWKGCGFGFRYQHLPHLLPARNQQQLSSASLQVPCPSPVLQEHLAAILRQHTELGTKLIDTLLNQVNWAFSKFLEMLQELQQYVIGPTTVSVSSHELKICATCFDISVGLLRVLEMVAHLTPELFTDWSQPLAEVLLCRLFQLLMQMLSRVTTTSNAFDTIVNSGIPGIETVDRFPILTAITGIIVALVLQNEQGQKCSTAALLAEPNFQLAYFSFLLGDSSGREATASASSQSKQVFSLQKYKEVNDEETQLVQKLIYHLQTEKSKSQSEVPEPNEEMVCSICYASPKSLAFDPCGHESCRACITRHLMSKGECFFCTAKVKGVVDIVSGQPVALS